MNKLVDEISGTHTFLFNIIYVIFPCYQFAVDAIELVIKWSAWYFLIFNFLKLLNLLFNLSAYHFFIINIDEPLFFFYGIDFYIKPRLSFPIED